MDVNSFYPNPVTDFLTGYISQKTRQNYSIAIRHYLRFVSPKECQETDFDDLARSYLSQLSTSSRDLFRDLKQFSIYLNERYAPTTVNLYLRSTLVWLEDNGYRVPRRTRSRISAQLPPPHPKVEAVELKRKTFRAVYLELPEDVGTLFLVLIASGMRIGEALKLKRNDVDWTQKRTAIQIPGEISKTKVPRVVYLTEEASDHLLRYLTDRRDQDEALFLISYQRARHALCIASGQFGSSSSPYSGIHWHMTRKWFLSRFSLVASRDVAEELAGHVGYLSRSYRRYTKKQIIKNYIKAEKKLSILSEHDRNLGF